MTISIILIDSDNEAKEFTETNAMCVHKEVRQKNIYIPEKWILYIYVNFVRDIWTWENYYGMYFQEKLKTHIA
jgi:hypothetical protein